MKSLLSKEKLIELFFKYPVAYFSIFFLYATRSQFYMINNIQIYDSIIHNLLKWKFATKHSSKSLSLRFIIH